MDDDDARSRMDVIDTADASEVADELRRLAADYPAFRFSTQAGWDREHLRLAADRIRGLDPGLRAVVTTDLGELRAVLGSDGVSS